MTKIYSMSRISLLLFFFSQVIVVCNSYASDTTGLAPVAVFVTDMKGKTSKGEQVLFKSETTQMIYSGRSDASGRFSTQLPIGDKYFNYCSNLEVYISFS